MSKAKEIQDTLMSLWENYPQTKAPSMAFMIGQLCIVVNYWGSEIVEAIRIRSENETE